MRLTGRKTMSTIKRAIMPETDDQPDQAEICQYVADMALELRSLCKQNNADYLAYLLEIVFIEASENATRKKVDDLQSLKK